MRLMYFSNRDRKLMKRWEHEEACRIEALKKQLFWKRVSAGVIVLEIVGFIWLAWRSVG